MSVSLTFLALPVQHRELVKHNYVLRVTAQFNVVFVRIRQMQKENNVCRDSNQYILSDEYWYRALRCSAESEYG